MVNITQILNLFETTTVHKILGQLDSSPFREVRGSKQWDGYYIHRSALGDILSHPSIQVNRYLWDNNTQCRPIDQFFGGEHIISIASDEMLSLILFNKLDVNVLWSSRTLTVSVFLKPKISYLNLARALQHSKISHQDFNVSAELNKLDCPNKAMLTRDCLGRGCGERM